MQSEKLLEKYMNGETISVEDYENVILSRNRFGKLYPIYQLSAYFYKVLFNEHNHKLCFTRIFSGELALMNYIFIERDSIEMVVRNLIGM